MAAGFSLVLEAIKESSKPGVVHNGILDVAYTLNSFSGSIPESWQDYKALARHWFPGVTCPLDSSSSSSCSSMSMAWSQMLS